jgi:hypothetical protein
MMDAGYSQEISGWSLKEQPPAYYRRAAARARKLQAEIYDAQAQRVSW